MTKEKLIGTWRCNKKVEKGVEKVNKHSKLTMTFEADGTGKIKILFIPLNFRWTLENNTLNMVNANDGTKLDTPIEFADDCIIMHSGNDASYFYKD